MKRWDLLGVTTGAFFVTMVARLAPSPLVPDLIDAFGVSTGTVGLALSGMWAAYALFHSDYGKSLPVVRRNGSANHR